MEYVDGLTMGDDGPEARNEAAAKLMRVARMGEAMAANQDR
jgi:hypothetical protein